MSSSSSADPSSHIAEQISGSLAALADALPEHHGALVGRAQGLRVLLTVDRDQCEIAFDQAGAHVRALATDPVDAEGRPVLRIDTDRATIRAVLAGSTTLHRAVLDDALRVRGELTAVDRALDVLVSYVLGAIHLPSEHRRHARFLTPTSPIGTGGEPTRQEPR